MAETAVLHGPEPGATAAPDEPHVVVPVWLYVVVHVALLALTATTAGVAFLDLGPLNNVVAVGIAVVKGLLVILYFMHVRWSPRLVPVAAFAGFFWLALLIAGTMNDYLTRGEMGVPGK